MDHSNNKPRRLFTVFLVLLASVIQAQGQRDILISDLHEYGGNLEFITSWTDDDFIVMLTRGRVGNYGYIFFLIHPDKGIVSRHEVPDKMNLTYYRIFSCSAEAISVFYKVQETGKSVTYGLTFSKATGSVDRQPIPEEIMDMEKQTYFRCLVDGRLLFATINKEKTKFALREITREGVDQEVYLFDLPKELLNYFKDISTGPSATIFAKVDQPDLSEEKLSLLERNVFIHNQTLRIILEDKSGKDIILSVVEFYLSTKKVDVYSRPDVNRYKSYAATFMGDSLFVMKTIKSVVIPPGNTLQLEILVYPALDRVRILSVDQSMKDIPFKTSHLTKVNYSTGLYHSGRNREYEDLEEGGPDVNRTLREVTREGAYIKTWRGSQGNVLLMLGSQLDQFITNTQKTNNSYFFGCLDKNLDPCVPPVGDKSPAEKMSAYLFSIQKEKPKIYEFGFKRTFVAFKLKSKDEIVIKEF